MTGIAKFYNKFFSFIELDPTRPDPLIFVNFLTQPGPTRGSTRPACNSALTVTVTFQEDQIGQQFVTHA